MAINKVELCGVNTSRLPVLNAEEKETLLKKARRRCCCPRTLHSGQSAPCLKRDQALLQQQ